MIDIREIYDNVVSEAAGRARNKSYTADGGLITRECYTYPSPVMAMHAVETTGSFEPIDLNNELKFVRLTKFNPAKIGAPLFARKPKRGCFGPVELGGSVRLDVDYSREIQIFPGGIASVGLLGNGEFEEAYLNTMIALEGLDDFEKEKKAARDAAGEEWMNSHKVNQDFIYKKRDDDNSKKTIRNQKQAINKKEARQEMQAASEKRDAEKEVIASRNSRLTENGLYDSAIRRIMGGSIDVDAMTMWWYPTALDLVRMFDLTIDIPVRVFLDIDDNDSEIPAEDPAFSRELLAESWSSANSGEEIFREIRDGWHVMQGGNGKGRFPRVKPKRWENITKKLKATKRPWNPQTDPPRTFVTDDKQVWEGATGGLRPLKFQTKSDGWGIRWNILTVDGLRIIYSNPDGEPATAFKTAFFMTPANLAQALREAIGSDAPKTIQLNMIRRTFQNIKYLMDEANDMFAQKGGSRRYIL